MINEKLKRHWAACEALALGRGGIATVAEATGLSRTTIRRGIKELQEQFPALVHELACGRVRKPGGGRPKLSERDPTLEADLRRLVDTATQVKPPPPLHWTTLSTRKLARELKRLGHEVSYRTVARLLLKLGYRVQTSPAEREGSPHREPDGQCDYVNNLVCAFQQRGQPVISVDASKRQLVAAVHRRGCKQPIGEPTRGRTPGPWDETAGLTVPAEMYGSTHKAAWQCVGIDQQTAEFAVESIRRWWFQMGRRAYPCAQELLIAVAACGPAGLACQPWRVGLQRLADASGMCITVCHLPPGTVQRNQIEHRMLYQRVEQRPGFPFVSHTLMVSLIASAGRATSRTTQQRLDTNGNGSGTDGSQEEMSGLRLTPHAFHGDWNYTIHPSSPAH